MTVLSDFTPFDPPTDEQGSSAATKPRHRQRKAVVWLSAADAAERAGVSPRTVKRWIKAGLLPAARLPSPKEGRGHLRIRLGDIEALVARGALR
jgi:excisionase family DNA binding protein